MCIGGVNSIDVCIGYAVSVCVQTPGVNARTCVALRKHRGPAGRVVAHRLGAMRLDTWPWCMCDPPPTTSSIRLLLPRDRACGGIAAAPTAVLKLLRLSSQVTVWSSCEQIGCYAPLGLQKTLKPHSASYVAVRAPARPKTYSKKKYGTAWRDHPYGILFCKATPHTCGGAPSGR